MSRADIVWGCVFRAAFAVIAIDALADDYESGRTMELVCRFISGALLTIALRPWRTSTPEATDGTRAL